MLNYAFLIVFVAHLSNFASLGDAVVNYTSIVQLKNGQIRGSVIDAGDGLQVEFYEAIKFGKFYLFVLLILIKDNCLMFSSRQSRPFQKTLTSKLVDWRLQCYFRRQKLHSVSHSIQ